MAELHKGGTPPLSADIAERARALYAEAPQINSLGEAQDAVKEAASLIYYLAERLGALEGAGSKSKK